MNDYEDKQFFFRRTYTDESYTDLVCVLGK